MRRYYQHRFRSSFQLREPVFNPDQASSPRRDAKKSFSSLGTVGTFRSVSLGESMSSELGLDAGYVKRRIYKPRSFFCNVIEISYSVLTLQ